MSKQVSIEVESLSHGSASIPAASRLGNVIASGGSSGWDPATHKLPEDLEAQTKAMSANVRRIVEAMRRQSRAHNQDDLLGAGPCRSNRPRYALDRDVPPAGSRPAHHTLVYELPDPMLVQCEFPAVVE